MLSLKAGRNLLIGRSGTTMNRKWKGVSGSGTECSALERVRKQFFPAPVEEWSARPSTGSYLNPEPFFPNQPGPPLAAILSLNPEELFPMTASYVPPIHRQTSDVSWVDMMLVNRESGAESAPYLTRRILVPCRAPSDPTESVEGQNDLKER